MAGLATPQVLSVDSGRTSGRWKPTSTEPSRRGRANRRRRASEALREFVANTDADIGIGHDGDADRIVVVAADGSVVHEDTIVAILAEHYVRETTAEEPVVVTTPNASARIDERVRAAGGSVERVRLGALHGDRPGVRAGRVRRRAVETHPHEFRYVDRRGRERGRPHWFRRRPRAGRPARAHHRAPYRKVSVDCPDDAKEPVMAALHSSLPDRFPDATVDYRLRHPAGAPRRFVDARPTLRHGGVRPRLRRERRRRRRWCRPSSPTSRTLSKPNRRPSSISIRRSSSRSTYRVGGYLGVLLDSPRMDSLVEAAREASESSYAPTRVLRRRRTRNGRWYRLHRL